MGELEDVKIYPGRDLCFTRFIGQSLLIRKTNKQHSRSGWGWMGMDGDGLWVWLSPVHICTVCTNNCREDEHEPQRETGYLCMPYSRLETT